MSEEAGVLEAANLKQNVGVAGGSICEEGELGYLLKQRMSEPVTGQKQGSTNGG